MDNNSPMMVSYLFVDEFISNHKIEEYNHDMLDEFPSSNTLMTVYLSNVYMYFHKYNGKNFLVVEVFREIYKVYVLEWPGNLKDFITTINNLDIFNINEKATHVNPYSIDVIEERKILETVLKSTIIDKEYIASRYGLK